MKSFLVALCLLALSHCGYSQAGMYKTYEDYLDDKVVKEYDRYVRTEECLGKYCVTFLTGDEREERIKIHKKEYWGYRTHTGHVYKIYKGKKIPILMVDRGVLTTYVDYRSYYTDEGKLNLAVDPSSLLPAYSLGDDDKLYPLMKVNVRKHLKKLGDDQDLEVLKTVKNDDVYLLTFIKDFNAKYASKDDGD